VHAFEILDQPEIRHLDVIKNKEQVLRLDIQVLQLVLGVHQIQGFRRFQQIADELVARDSGQTLLPAFAKTVPDRAIGQLHHYDELIVNDIEAFQRQDERMMDGLDAIKGLELLVGSGVIVAGLGAKVAVHELDGFEEPARSLGFPDFAEAAPADPLNEAVALDRLRTALNPHGHGQPSHLSEFRLRPRAGVSPTFRNNNLAPSQRVRKFAHTF
jgi:hypothetical protein